jgi:pimeloyl-ACP methyl ester carboxylesterase
MRGYFTTSDGVRLGYEQGGVAEGPPVLFSYGLLCSAFHFKYQWDYLAPRFRLIMLDYRGHHISEDPEAVTSLTFPRMADDLAEFLDAIGEARPVSVVGHSMGVNLALEFNLRHPARVGALALIAGAATFPARSEAERRRMIFMRSVMQIMDGLFPRWVDEFWRLQGSRYFADAVAGQVAGFVGFNPRLSKREDIRKVIEVMSGLSPKVFFHLLGEYLRHDVRNKLARVQVPALIVSGEKDRMVPPRFQKQLHEGIKGSRLATVPDGSHCPQFDRPGDVNVLLEAFLSGSAGVQNPSRRSRPTISLKNEI